MSRSPHRLASPIAGGPRPVVLLLLVALLCLIWGSTWLVIQQGLRDLPPFSSAAARFGVAAVLMVPTCALLTRREGGSRAPWWLAGVVGTLQFATSYAIVYWVETRLPSALTSILWASYPLMIAMAAHFAIPGERLRGAQIVGFLTGFAGVVLLFVTDIRGIGDPAIPAALLLLCSPLVVAISTVCIKRHATGVSSLHLNRNALFVGAAELTLLAFVVEDPTLVHFTPAALFSVGYLALIGTVLAFGVYHWLLRYAAATRLAVIPYISPAVAVLLGVTVAGEPVSQMTVLGLALILTGVVLVTRLRAGPPRVRP